MTKLEAQKAMEEGKKVSHKYFSSDEYCYMKDGDIYTEEGYNMGGIHHEFWVSRTGGFWENDWSIYNEMFDVSEVGFDDDEFQCCDNCDLPDACADFGCAIKKGIRKPVEW